MIPDEPMKMDTVHLPIQRYAESHIIDTAVTPERLSPSTWEADVRSFLESFRASVEAMDVHVLDYPTPRIEILIRAEVRGVDLSSVDEGTAELVRGVHVTPREDVLAVSTLKAPKASSH